VPVLRGGLPFHDVLDDLQTIRPDFFDILLNRAKNEFYRVIDC
jgi:hypothetical protein